VESTLHRGPARLVSATGTTVLDAYEISTAKNHDVYGSFSRALAREYDADYLITTDSDFDDTGSSLGSVSRRETLFRPLSEFH
jgi:predicted nucleic acid-binding protein